MPQLCVLHVEQCGLRTLDGLAQCPALQILKVNGNCLSSLGDTLPLHLRILDARHNQLVGRCAHDRRPPSSSHHIRRRRCQTC